MASGSRSAAGRTAFEEQLELIKKRQRWLDKLQQQGKAKGQVRALADADDAHWTGASAAFLPLVGACHPV